MKKVIGKILLILIPLVAAAGLLYPTFRYNEVNDLKKAAEARADQAETAEDSLTIMEDFNTIHGEDYKFYKNNRLKLGLDLRGGMYVTLEVDIIKLLEESAMKETREDDVFPRVIEATRELTETNDQPVIDNFMTKFREIAEPAGKSLIQYFDFGDLKDVTEEKIIENLRNNADGAIDQAYEVIRQRIDKYGVSEPNIQKQGNRRILLELPGVQNEVEMRNLIQTTARLEFCLVKGNADLVRAFYKIDKMLAEKAKRQGKLESETPESSTVSQAIAGETTEAAESTTLTDESSTATADTANPYANMSDEEVQKQYLDDHPFTTLFQTYYSVGRDGQSQPVNYMVNNFPDNPDGRYSFMITEYALPKFRAILNRPEVKALLPYNVKLLRHAKPIRGTELEDNKVYNLHAIKGDPELTGDVVSNAYATYDPTNNSPIVIMGMNADGAERWSSITGANVGKQIAIVLDGQVYSAPNVQNRITGGSSQITGMADVQEARLLEIVLKAGALKAPVQIIEERVVGPSLGEDSISAGFTASGVAFLLVILYMIFYYAKGGTIADFAVFLNVALIFSLLAAFEGTLTLPGIAGIILTIGMAVDANVLIFERIREERFKGRSIRSAIDEGFSKALSAILDTNITTGITALILYFLGSGPIKGFALTLLIGIFCTLFTAIMVTRAVVEIFMAKDMKLGFGEPKQLKKD